MKHSPSCFFPKQMGDLMDVGRFVETLILKLDHIEVNLVFLGGSTAAAGSSSYRITMIKQLFSRLCSNQIQGMATIIFRSQKNV